MSTIPEKSDLIECFNDKLVKLYACHISNTYRSAYEFNRDMVNFLVNKGHSKTFSGIVASVYVVVFGFSDRCRFTTTKNRRDQLEILAKQEKLDMVSYVSKYSCKISIIISKEDGNIK